MRIQPSVIDPPIDTIAELRELYRASESRAARLRMLTACEREMAAATIESIDTAVGACASRLAYFTGRAHAEIVRESGEGAIAIPLPGAGNDAAAYIRIDGLASIDLIPDAEDREAVRMQLELMGLTIDRIERERERVRLLETLQEREQRLEYLVGSIFSAQEEERRRVSHELHDGVAQTATALVRMLEGATTAPDRDIPAAERVKLTSIARDLVTELRAVIGGLRPTLLDDFGLDAAIQALADSLQSDGFDVHLTLHGGACERRSNVETALYRVAQEAIANIRKHAGGPCRVEIELNHVPSENGNVLRVQDFGIGCHPVAADCRASLPGNHVGIDVMRERMAAVGGLLSWTAEPGQGVTVIARLPKAV